MKTAIGRPAVRIALVLAMAAVIGSCGNGSGSARSYEFRGEDAAAIRVAVYLDYGIWDGVEVTVGNMLKGMKCVYTAVDKDSISTGGLEGYSLLLMPGGDMWEYNAHLGSQAMEKIRDYVSRGGGYVGICGGAYFAAEKIVWNGWANEPRKNISIEGLKLFSGIAQGPIEDFAPTYKDVKCPVKIVDPTHPITASLPDVIRPVYDHGPAFLPDGKNGVSVLGTTVRGDKTVVMAFPHGSGRVFLTALHPELDSTRVSWPMVKNALLWCARK